MGFTNPKILPTFLLLGLLGSAIGCKKQDANIPLSALAGGWERNADGNPDYAGMRLLLVSDAATIDSGTLGSFSLGQKKWRAITALRDSTFSYEELGSDGQYYSAQFSVQQSAAGLVINCVVRNQPLDNDGVRQTWLKR